MNQVPEITPLELVRQIDAGEPLQILDVRPPASAAAARIDLVPVERYANVVGSQVLAGGLAEFTAVTGLDPDRPIAVVCGFGMSSRPVAELLARSGRPAVSLRGGMAAWLHTLVPRELDPPAGFDRLVQVERPAKGALGYLLVAGGEALVVDPPRHWHDYEALAGACGARIVGVADTHVHADYLSGAASLSATLGVPYFLHRADAVDSYDGTPARLDTLDLADRPALPLGGATVEVRPTPGHTPGSVTFVAGDAALTGDFLFLRSVGRPDLGDRAKEWGEQLWRSLVSVREWPDDLRVLPAHYGSPSERGPGGRVSATLGELRPGHPALRLARGEELAAWVAARCVSFPDAYRQIKRANVGLLSLEGRTADELEAGRNRCALPG